MSTSKDIEVPTLKYQYAEPNPLSNVFRKYVTDKDIAELKEVMNDETVDLKFSESGHLLSSKIVVINYGPDQSIQAVVFKPYPPSPYIALVDPKNRYYGENFNGSNAITNAIAAIEVKIQLSTNEAMWNPFNDNKVLIPFLDSDGNMHPITKAKFMELPYERRLRLMGYQDIRDSLNEVDAEDLLDPPREGRGPISIYLVERTDDYTWENTISNIVTAYTEEQAKWVSMCEGIGAGPEYLKVTKVGHTDILPPRKLILSKEM